MHSTKENNECMMLNKTTAVLPISMYLQATAIRKTMPDPRGKRRILQEKKIRSRDPMGFVGMDQDPFFLHCHGHHNFPANSQKCIGNTMYESRIADSTINILIE